MLALDTVWDMLGLRYISQKPCPEKCDPPLVRQPTVATGEPDVEPLPHSPLSKRDSLAR